MIEGYNRKVNRIIAITLAIMFVFAATYSEYYVCREALHQHKCHDEDCPICTVIEQSNSIISNILLTESINPVVFIRQDFLKATNNEYIYYYNPTLVADNVRLNE